MSQLTCREQVRRTLRQLMVKAGTACMSSLLRPILGFRLTYLSLLMVYFAYGALGLIDVTRDRQRQCVPPAPCLTCINHCRSISGQSLF